MTRRKMCNVLVFLFGYFLDLWSLESLFNTNMAYAQNAIGINYAKLIIIIINCKEVLFDCGILIDESCGFREKLMMFKAFNYNRTGIVVNFDYLRE